MRMILYQSSQQKKHNFPDHINCWYFYITNKNWYFFTNNDKYFLNALKNSMFLCKISKFLWEEIVLVDFICFGCLDYNECSVATIIAFEISLFEVSKSIYFQSTSTTNTKMSLYLYDTKRYLKLLARYLWFSCSFSSQNMTCNSL